MSWNLRDTCTTIRKWNCGFNAIVEYGGTTYMGIENETKKTA